MTIRFTCIGCESVLKIKDEKAGSKGRCPKCKAEFMVPFASADEDQDEESSLGNNALPMDDPDMPLELTPQVEDHPDFDPLDVLSGPKSTAQTSGTKSASGASGKKPSVAELMREFESVRKKDRRKDSESEVGRPTVSSTPAQTVGTATNALSRAYQQKRESANAPVISVKDAKAAEQRALLIQFLLKKAGPIVAAVLVFIGAYYWYMTQEFYSGIPLFPVSGKVISQSSDVAGLRVLFTPVISGISDPRGSAEAVTAQDGSFELIYMEPHKGAPAGKYEVSVYGASGVPLSLSEGTPMLTVSDTEPNNFQIKL
ncbi:MAG: hypothetical protein KDB01_27960 [Planctomycetaceae bacterium]|nr:hypothetical protein [Planctomycetaceae bacterium]